MSASSKNKFVILSIFATLSAFAFSISVVPPLITTISADFTLITLRSAAMWSLCNMFFSRLRALQADGFLIGSGFRTGS